MFTVVMSLWGNLEKTW